MVVVGLWPCDGAHIIYWLPGQKIKPILIMVLNNEVLLVELVILIPNGAKSNPHSRETNFKPRTQLLISFCHKPKSLETIGGINPKKKKKLWDIFLVDKLKRIACWETYYSLPIMYVHTKLLSSFNHFCIPSFPS
jgi:hypothetical protein